MTIKNTHITWRTSIQSVEQRITKSEMQGNEAWQDYKIFKFLAEHCNHTAYTSWQWNIATAIQFRYMLTIWCILQVDFPKSETNSLIHHLVYHNFPFELANAEGTAWFGAEQYLRSVRHHGTAGLQIRCASSPFSDLTAANQTVHLGCGNCHPQRLYISSRLEIDHLSVENFLLRVTPTKFC
jgi:hypothetical protein